MNEIRDLLIGIDFGKKNTQICYYDRKAQEIRSLSMKVGTSLYEAPTVLCRRAGQKDYSVGTEAEYFAREKGGELIGDLYEISGRTEPYRTEEEEVRPWLLVSHFLKGMLRFLGVMEIVKNTRCLAITCPALTGIRVENLRKACEGLGFSPGQYVLLDYGESFYYYAMTQKKELISRSVAWYDFRGNDVVFRKMTINTLKKPALVRLEEPDKTTLPSDDRQRDEAFSIFIQKTLGTEMFASIQITGEGFDQSWARESVRILCFQKRKVYFGNNLHARGACAAGKERLEDHNLKNFRFLSDSLIRKDVGMEMRVMGSPAYYPLVKNGSNWYECRTSCELILDNMEELIFVVSDMGESEKKKVSMKLPELPKRPNKTTRLQLSLQYLSAEQCLITVTDLGFGDMYPATGKVWQETVTW